MILIGDFNCDCTNTSLRQTQRLNEFLHINDLKQLITSPTRTSQTSSSLIDLIITTSPHLFKRSGTLSNSFSDHYPIYGVMEAKTDRQKHKLITTRKYDQNRVDNFNEDLTRTIATNSFQTANEPGNGTNSRWKNAIFILQELVEKHFPKTTKRIRHKTHPWLDTDTLRLMRKRDKIHKQAVNSNDDQLWAQYRKLRNQSTLILRKQRKQYFKSTLEAKGRDSKAFWKILHTVLPGKTKSQANINKLIVNDTEITECKQLANTLNDYFITVAPNLLQPDHQAEQDYSQHPHNDINISRTPEPQKTSSHFSFRKLTVNEVFTALKTTNPS